MARTSSRFGRVRPAAVTALLLAGCVGPPVQVVPNAFSEGRSEALIAADMAQYDAPCMRVKCYGVWRSLGLDSSPADLPASAVEKARATSP